MTIATSARSVSQPVWASFYIPLLMIGLLLFGTATDTWAQSLSVSMNYPAFRASFITGTDVTIRATATAPAGETVAKVEFFLATYATGPKTTTKLGEDLTAPFTYTWTIPAGQISYNELSVKVTSSTGATAVQGGNGYIRVDVYPPTFNGGKKYYVQASASASNTAGTLAAPFNTIQKAVDLVTPGDSIFVMAGTYTNTGTSDAVTIRRTGTPDHWVVFTNYQNDRPKVTFNSWQGFNLIPGAAYIKIQGFEIEGNNATITLPEATTQPGSCDNPTGTVNPRYNGNGISINGRTGGNLRPHHIVIASNVVHDCSGGGIIGIESDYVTLENNTIYNTSWYTIYGTSGISFLNCWNYDANTDTPKIIIRNNRTYGNRLFVRWFNAGVCKGITDGNGIILDNNNDRFGANPLGAYTGKFLLENNVSYLNGGRGINLNYSSNVTLLNNTCYQNAISPEIESDFTMRYSDNTGFYNNIFSGRSDKLLTTVVNSLNLQQDANLSFGGTGTSYFSGGTNKVGLDPQFMDAAGGNFGLSGTSPALNAGSSVAGQYAQQDIAGVSRPQGAGVDIGAYELRGMPIIITQQPASSSTVCAGGAVTISVQVDGPVQAYQWYKDGSVLTGVASATTAILSLSSVTASDQGSYSVGITGFNSLTSTAFTLGVGVVPPVSLSASGPISCTASISTLTASPGSGVTYTFSSGATPGSEGNTATVTQAGTYSVVATSPQGCTASASVDVSGGLSAPDAPNVSSATATQGTGNVPLTVTNCPDTVNWNGADGGTTLVVSTTAVGDFVYTVGCKTGVCVSPLTSVTVTVKAPPVRLNVSHRDGDNNQPTNNVIRPYLQLSNPGNINVPYGEISIRYWVTVEDFSPVTNLSVYWAQLGTNKVKMTYVPLAQPRQEAFGYIEYTFDPSAGTLVAGGNSGEIQTGLGKQDWTTLTETNDYSFAPNATYTPTDRITVYHKGVLIGGIEPVAVAPVRALKVYSENRNSSPTTNQISTYLKVVNEGNVPVDYSQLSVRYWFSAEGSTPLVYNLDYTPLGKTNISGTFVRENRTGTDTYLDLRFAPAMGALNPLSSTGITQQRINKTDWSDFNEANDYAYQPAAPLAENTHMTAYLNGTLVYGLEPAPSGARVVAGEPSGLRVTVLGNPTQDNTVLVDVTGAESQSLRFELINRQGQVFSHKQIEQADSVERVRLPVGHLGAGMFWIRVSTPFQNQTLKLLKL